MTRPEGKEGKRREARRRVYSGVGERPGVMMCGGRLCVVLVRESVVAVGVGVCVSGGGRGEEHGPFSVDVL